MEHAEIEALNLQPGDKIRIKVRFREEPIEGEFIRLYVGLMLWKSNFREQGKSLSEVLEVSKITPE